MSAIVVLGFKDEESVDAFQPTLDQLVEDEAFVLEDAVTVSVGLDGMPKYRHSHSLARGGAVAGGLLGGLVGLLVLNPIAGAAIGAAGGSALGKLSGDYGIEEEFIEQTSKTLAPGTAALFLQVAFVKPGAMEQVAKNEGITVITTRLSKESREARRRLRALELADTQDMPAAAASPEASPVDKRADGSVAPGDGGPNA